MEIQALPLNQAESRDLHEKTANVASIDAGLIRLQRTHSKLKEISDWQSLGESNPSFQVENLAS